MLLLVLLLGSTTTNNNNNKNKGGSGGGFVVVNAQQGNSNFLLPPAHGNIGRSIKGRTWNATNQTFDIYYYVKIEYIQGGNNISDCVMNNINDAFVVSVDEDDDSSNILIEDITLDQIGMIEWDHARANAAGIVGPGGGGGSDAPATAITKKKSLVAVEDNANEVRQIGGTMMTRQRGGGGRQMEEDMDMEEQEEEDRGEDLIEEEVTTFQEGDENQEEEEYYHDGPNDDDQRWREELDFMQSTMDNIRDYFHDIVSSITGGRFGWSYKIETIVGVYLNDGANTIYMNNFSDIIELLPPPPSTTTMVINTSSNMTTKATTTTTTTTTTEEADDYYVDSFKEFVLEELKRVVHVNVPSVEDENNPFDDEFFFERGYYYYNQYPLRLFVLSDTIWDCIQGLEGDYGVDPNQETSTIVGRAITGTWGENGVEYEILSYIEIFRIMGVNENEDRTKECFYTSLESLFVDPYTATSGTTIIYIDDMTTQQKNIARSVGEQDDLYRKSLNITQLQEYSSIYSDHSDSGGWTISTGNGHSMSSERGVAVFLNGTFIQSYDDTPDGFDRFVKDALQTVLETNVTSLFPTDFDIYEDLQPYLFEESENNRGGLRSIYVFLIPELLNSCIETSTNGADAMSQGDKNATTGEGFDEGGDDNNGDDQDSVINQDGAHYFNAWISTTVVATTTLMMATRFLIVFA